MAQPKLDRKLQSKIEVSTRDFAGTVGVYVLDLKTQKFAAINPDTLFPTASMVKVPIMVGVFDAIEQGKLSYNQELIFKDSLKYDDGVVGSFKPGTKISLSELMFLMESISDNTASLWLQGLVSGTKINENMEKLGLKHLRVNSRTEGRQAIRNQYGWGVCTPKDMVLLFKYLYEGKVISAEASERILRTLSYQYWDGEGLSQLPPSIKFASKTGAVDRSRSETTLVYGKKSTYIYCIVTKLQKDTSYEKTNEGFKLIRLLSSVIYNHFESNYPFQKLFEKY
jgi:beta-lactamase class A